MNEKQREALRNARDRIAWLNSDSEAKEHTDIGDAWDVLGEAFNAINLLLDDSKPEIYQTLVLSTSHVRKATAERLDAICTDGTQQQALSTDIDGYICKWSIYGWVFYCHDHGEETPSDLVACAAYARAQGCDFIRFDCDGPVMSQLPSWEW